MSENIKDTRPVIYCKKCGDAVGRYVTNDICSNCWKKKELEDKKHEKINQMAWEMLNTLFSIWLNSNCCENFKKFSRGDLMQYAFEVSEAFYDYAKEKEEGAGENNKT